MAKQWDVASATRCVTRNGGKVKGNLVKITKGKVGIRVWGAIDFLVNHKQHVVTEA